MSEIVERVARAIFDDLRDRRGIKQMILHHEDLPHEAGFEDNRDWLTETAQAAILAMLKPSEEWLSEVAANGIRVKWNDLTPEECGFVWTAMIDEALK